MARCERNPPNASSFNSISWREFNDAISEWLVNISVILIKIIITIIIIVEKCAIQSSFFYTVLNGAPITSLIPQIYNSL